jgi:hypothetical protein
LGFVVEVASGVLRAASVVYTVYTNTTGNKYSQLATRCSAKTEISSVFGIKTIDF